MFYTARYYVKINVLICIDITMDVITTEKSLNEDTKFILKMNFIDNALDDGWEVKKKEGLYIFTKNHEGRKEVFSDDFLTHFVKKNFKIRSDKQ